MRERTEMKGLIAVLICFVILTLGYPAYANTATYQVSVTIPVLIGINYFPEKKISLKHNNLKRYTNSEQMTEVMVEELVRNNKKVMVKTFVAK